MRKRSVVISCLLSAVIMLGISSTVAGTSYSKYSMNEYEVEYDNQQIDEAAQPDALTGWFSSSVANQMIYHTGDNQQLDEQLEISSKETSSTNEFGR
ncbi:hypothetical protein [Lentibacillus sediminis]|uniref:hypothetical protein n=1 Tax=Lentibacillus sediminis TaxID=1940529 RepID=UPI000C1C5D71|nr:hypothetical protein [Lentibacillus sediminis]